MQVNNPSHWARGQLELIADYPACDSDKRTSIVSERSDKEGSMPDRWRMMQCGDYQPLWPDMRPKLVNHLPLTN